MRSTQVKGEASAVSSKTPRSDEDVERSCKRHRLTLTEELPSAGSSVRHGAPALKGLDELLSNNKDKGRAAEVADFLARDAKLCLNENLVEMLKERFTGDADEKKRLMERVEEQHRRLRHFELLTSAQEKENIKLKQQLNEARLNLVKFQEAAHQYMYSLDANKWSRLRNGSNSDVY